MWHIEHRRFPETAKLKNLLSEAQIIFGEMNLHICLNRVYLSDFDCRFCRCIIANIQHEQLEMEWVGGVA